MTCDDTYKRVINYPGQTLSPRYTGSYDGSSYDGQDKTDKV